MRRARKKFEAVIGLEVHAQLRTSSKMFCGCSTAFGAPPNTHTCPVCLGLPGALPVPNRQAVALAMRAALALNCRVNGRSIWARKNYFYPDLPKGYQITQYDSPLAEAGELAINTPQGEQLVGISRLHLEEDAGKSIHLTGQERSLVDFNRCGVPLAEIVSEPALRTPDEAAEFFKELRTVLVAVGVCDGNMERGSLRCDANVSLRPAGSRLLGEKVEIKNLNSFRFMRKALHFEVERQAALLLHRERVMPETRSFDSARGVTKAMRSKEEAHDYRYFPEPDLPPLSVDAAWIEQERAALPELVDRRTIPGKVAKEVLAAKVASGKTAPQVIQERLLSPLRDAKELMPVVAKVLAGHPAEVEKYRGGKKALLGFFVGQVMKATARRADPKVVGTLLGKALQAKPGKHPGTRRPKDKKATKKKTKARKAKGKPA